MLDCCQLWQLPQPAQNKQLVPCGDVRVCLARLLVDGLLTTHLFWAQKLILLAVTGLSRTCMDRLHRALFIFLGHRHEDTLSYSKGTRSCSKAAIFGAFVCLQRLHDTVSSPPQPLTVLVPHLLQQLGSNAARVLLKLAKLPGGRIVGVLNRHGGASSMHFHTAALLPLRVSLLLAGASPAPNLHVSGQRASRRCTPAAMGGRGCSLDWSHKHALRAVRLAEHVDVMRRTCCAE